jgi:serine/threonine protein kinase
MSKIGKISSIFRPQRRSPIDLCGSDIGHYHIVEKLGTGGMAVVYRAFDRQLQRDVAIKIIRTDAFPPQVVERMRQRFEREALSLAQMDHPNIIPIYDYGEFDQSPYLVMKFIRGGTLKDYILSGKPIDFDQAARLLEPVARALNYAHSRNIIHRDVKPANILISENGIPLLSDFGVAKILEEEEGVTLTSDNAAVGTPEYMAPEQWENQISPQTDIYALGVVFYELVTGHKPYTADTPAAVHRMALMDPLVGPKKWVEDLPDEVEAIIFKALARDPKDRYVSMEEMASALEKLTGGILFSQHGEPNKSPKPMEVPEKGDHTRDQKLSDIIKHKRPAKHKTILNRRWLLGGLIMVLLIITLAVIKNPWHSFRGIAPTPDLVANQSNQSTPDRQPQLSSTSPAISSPISTSTMVTPFLTTTSAPTQVLPSPTIAMSYPLRIGTPLPKSAVLSVDNVNKITELAQWGNGKLNALAVSKDNKEIAVATSTNVFIYNRA